MKAGAISIVGGDSLIGREIRELLAEAKLPAPVKLVGVDADTAALTEQDGEPVVLTPLDEDALRGSQVAVLAGSATSSRRALGLAGKSGSGPIFIDLTYALEQEPSAHLRAPMVEPAGFKTPAEAIEVVAHPAAVALTLFLTRLHPVRAIRRATVHIFEPASERGSRGLDELQKQTVNLLSFRPLPKDIYDAQAGFNMLSSYGSEAPEALEAIELRIERHLASLLGAWGNIPMPSIRLIQAPVFHGYSMSAHVEFQQSPDLATLLGALASPRVDVRDGDLEPPTNVGIAGQGGIAVGSIAIDRNSPAACWFWIVADNFRLVAENALDVLRSFLAPGAAA